MQGNAITRHQPRPATALATTSSCARAGAGVWPEPRSGHHQGQPDSHSMTHDQGYSGELQTQLQLRAIISKLEITSKSPDTLSY